MLSFLFIGFVSTAMDKGESSEGLAEVAELMSIRLSLGKMDRTLYLGKKVRIDKREAKDLHDDAKKSLGRQVSDSVSHEEVDDYCKYITDAYNMSCQKKLLCDIPNSQTDYFRHICEKRKLIYDNKEAPNLNRMTPLMSAVDWNKSKAVNWLLNAGADKEARDKDGKTPLMYAARDGSREVMELLLKLGANKEAHDTYGNTALMIAAGCGHREVMELLLKSGADKDASGMYGKTALMIAVAYRNIQAVELLLKSGADKDVRDINGKTAKDYALERGLSYIAKLF
jgi:predicted nucleic acid-binding OB-fold protein